LVLDLSFASGSSGFSNADKHGTYGSLAYYTTGYFPLPSAPNTP
jgi:hypothetical protein